MTQIGRTLLGWVAIVALSIGAAGCSRDSDEVGDARVRASLQESLAAMTSDNVSEATRATIQEAADNGVPITFEQVREAQLAAIECLKDLGFNVFVQDDALAPGGLGYAYGIPGRTGDFPPELEVAGEECESKSVMWLELAYQRTNSLPELDYDAIFATYREAMFECIRRQGGTIRDDATLDETLQISFELGGSPPCVGETGLDVALSGR